MPDTLSPLGQALAQTRRYRIMELARGRAGLVPMGRGDPDLPTPAHIVEAGRRALDGWGTHYTAAEGAPRLRQAIAGKLRAENGLAYDARDIIVTSGAQEALYLAIQCLLARGQAAVVTDPYYGAYTQMAQAAGARLVPVAAAGTTMEPDVAAIERAMTPDVRLLILVSPNNPSTNVIADVTLEALARLAIERDLWVLSDEIYEKLVFDGRRHRSIASLPGMQARTIVVNGFAKTYCMTGWRVGYAAGPQPLITAMKTLKQAITICAPAVAQAAALAALEGPQQCVADLLATYEERRRVVLAALDRMRMPYVRHQGTFYVYADVSAGGKPADAFAEALLLDGNVLVFPSTEFGAGTRHIRLSLLQPVPVLEDAMTRIAKVWAAHLPGGVR
jgi:aspartate/methionine/tyrosine aminotransferase